MKHSILKSLALAATLAAFLTGCSTMPKVNTEFDEKADFAEAKTYAIKPISNEIPGVDPGYVMRVRPAAMEAIRTSMSAKGYVEVDEPKDADIALMVHGKSVPKTDVTDWGFEPVYYRAGWYRGYPYGSYGMSNVSVDQYDEGTLMVEVYDVATQKMIWVGWLSGRRSSDTSKHAERLAAGITEVISAYPAAGQGMAPAAGSGS